MPAEPYRLPPAGRDGVLVRRGGALVRALWVEEEQVVVRAWPATGAVCFHAEAGTEAAAARGIERMRFALGTDHDLSEFRRRFRDDALIGPPIRARPWVRPRRRPEPFEALAWAVCEQLIDGRRAAAIQRSIVRSHGRRSACGTLRAPPPPSWVAARSPAELDACGLAPARSVALVRAAREVASGRADLTLHEPSWKRLLTIRGIGRWTIEMLAFEGQGRDDILPALDLAYVKLVGELTGLRRRATEDEVRAFFAPYEEWAGIAGLYALQRRYMP
ncbi:MAG TPA: hypothetical protein VFB44_15785 [Thermoleophilaceae bacterium]|nr:hypothetical protein [Thermoleophilaceae bacterium]